MSFPLVTDPKFFTGQTGPIQNLATLVATQPNTKNKLSDAEAKAVKITQDIISPQLVKEIWGQLKKEFPEAYKTWPEKPNIVILGSKEEFVKAYGSVNAETKYKELYAFVPTQSKIPGGNQTVYINAGPFSMHGNRETFIHEVFHVISEKFNARMNSDLDATKPVTYSGVQEDLELIFRNIDPAQINMNFLENFLSKIHGKRKRTKTNTGATARAAQASREVA